MSEIKRVQHKHNGWIGCVEAEVNGKTLVRKDSGSREWVFDFELKSIDDKNKKSENKKSIKKTDIRFFNA